MKSVKLYSGAVLATLCAIVAPAALAVVDYSTLTTAVDWEDVITALLAVGAAIILVLVAMKGIKLVTRMVRGA